MRTSWKVSLGAAAAAIGIVAAAVTESSATTVSPGFVAGSGSCTTDANGICTITHSLGAVPDSVVVSSATPQPFNGYIVNTVNGSYTSTTFQVRAMFTPTQPKQFGTIWLNYVASVGEQAPPPTSSTEAPPTSTVAPPPSSSSPTDTPPPSSIVPPPSSTVPPVTASGLTCAKPDTLPEQDGGDYGPYFVHNNAWNWGGKGSGQHESMSVCSASSWNVSASGMKGTDVKTYPNSHLDVNGGDKGSPWSSFSTITGKFADTVPAKTGGWDAAWDLWLNGLADNNSTEVMVWEDYHNQTPAGDIVGTYTAGGVTYDVWTDHDGYVAYVAQGAQASGTVDLRALILDGIAKNIIPAAPVVNQIDYGIEFCSTGSGTLNFGMSDFAVTLQ